MPTGLLRRDGGRYSTRRRVPLDLLPHYRGKADIVRALGTSNLAEAKLRHALMWVSLDREFAAARLALPAIPAAQRASIPHVMTEHDIESVEFWAQDSLAEEFDPERKRAADARSALRDQWEAEAKESRAFRAREAADEKKATGGVALSVVVARWAAERKPIPRTVRRAENIIERFEAVVGKLPVNQITRQHVLDFKDKMLAMGQTPANTNILLTILGVVLNYAMKNNLIPTNPASAIRVQDKRLAKSKRVFFDEAALASIFGSAIYREGVRPRGAGGEAAYWLPLLALYTGGRLDEVGQLHPDDVRQEGYRDGDTEKTAWVIRFTDNPERNQRLKNEGSRRRVPVHADLIALGFLDVAKTALAAGRGRIFHELSPANDDKETGNYSKWFGRYRRAKLGLKTRATPFHSFRHSFKYYGQYSDIAEPALRALLGHETGDTSDDYDALNYPLPRLIDAVAKYKVPGFVLPAPPAGVRA